MAPPWAPARERCVSIAALGLPFMELKGVVGCRRVIASQRLTVEFLHALLVPRDGDPGGSVFGGSAFLRGCAPLRYRPPLGCRSALSAGTTLGNGSLLLRRSALRRSPSFWSRSIFCVDRALAAR